MLRIAHAHPWGDDRPPHPGRVRRQPSDPATRCRRDLRRAQQYGDLASHGNRREFRLHEAGANPLAVRDGSAGVVVDPGAEAGKRLEFLELRIGQLQVSHHRTVGCSLGLAANPGDGLADIDRRQHAELEQGGREVDLPVGDGDEVGRDIRGEVLSLGFDDGQRGEGAAALILAQVGGAFQQPRMDVEDVPRESFAAGGSPQQQRQLAIGRACWVRSS